MKSNFPRVGLAKICGWFGITRQAYYKNQNDRESKKINAELVLNQVKKIRLNHKRIGTRKLFSIMEPFKADHKIKMGRDALFDLLSTNCLLIRKRRRATKTTNSTHWMRKYPNLTKDFSPTQINQLWVSDITYWKLKNESVLYISLITDAYSHQIVGYQVAKTLESRESIKALNMALSKLSPGRSYNLIHHSDRGLQYCSQNYVALLSKFNIKISMTENGDPLENAVAERINGILKEEYLEFYDINTLDEAKEALHRAVSFYNTERPHMSISYLTPSNVHNSNQPIKIKKQWKNYYQKKLCL